MNEWDLRFLSMAQLVARWSKDPSTQVGAVIVRPDKTIASIGYNGFPRGVEDTHERYADKVVKHEMVVHAEANAIHNSREPVVGYTIYSTFFPCPHCAAHIIQAGIKRVVSIPNASDIRYIGRRKISEQMFNEAGVIFNEEEQDNNKHLCSNT